MSSCARILLAAAAALSTISAAAASDTAIYTCTDAHGRTITTDRPIAACTDRIQRRLGRSGTTIRVIEPELTATEREAAEEQQRIELQRQRRARAKVREMAQRDRALLIRYPDRSAHERARMRALEQVDAAITAANAHLVTLTRERRELDQEFEFYETEPDRIPAELTRSLERNRDATDVTLKLIASQEFERERINARYDAEIEHLETLWRAQADPDREAAE